MEPTYTEILTFQVKEIKKNIATGAVHIMNRKPHRDDYFYATGEVEFGGGYQQTGHFSDGAYNQANDQFSYQCTPNGTYHIRKVTIPSDIKIKPGQFIRVKYSGKLNTYTELVFHKDREVGAKRTTVKKFQEMLKPVKSFWK